MSDWLVDSLLLISTVVLVVVNGFFVSAEFALIKVRRARLQALSRQKRLFAKTADWLAERLEASISACQLGITMASLGLGWIGEPALADLLEPAFEAAGLQSEQLLSALAFTIAFAVITAAHLVAGEQAPKLFSIRNPEPVLLWCAIPLKGFYILTYPFLVGLNQLSFYLLRLVGLTDGSHEEAHHSEEEIRALLKQAQVHGELSRSEHQLLHAVFEFDDLICRRIMLPRRDVVICDITRPMSEFLELVRTTKHTRYPVCEHSLDNVIGVVHIKDLVGLSNLESFDVRQVMRPPKRVPGTMPISRLLRFFQKTHQLMAFVLNEHGTTVGVVTLENVTEQIVGPVDDEFDSDLPDIIPDGRGCYIVLGSTPVRVVNEKLDLHLDSKLVDTFSGVLMNELGRVPETGDRIELGLEAVAEVLEVKDLLAARVRVPIPEAPKNTATGTD